MIQINSVSRIGPVHRFLQELTLLNSSRPTICARCGLAVGPSEGAGVTFWNFVAMLLAVTAALLCLPTPTFAGNLYGFLGAFLVLFIASGIGNGSTFRMIPIIFLGERQWAAQGRGPAAREQPIKDGNKEAAAVLGFSSIIGAYGGLFIPKIYGISIALTGGPEADLYVFIVFYLSCIAMTWWYYARGQAEMPC